jgi:transcriptional regulator with XRE-family HTH domain
MAYGRSQVSRMRRPQLLAEANRRNLALLATLGGELRDSRRRRRMTQAQIGARAGVSQPTISRMEVGRGGSLSMDAWQRAFAGVDRTLVLNVTRDRLEETADAGHLRIQDLVLRLAQTAGYRGLFELSTRPLEPARSADVGLRDDRRRRLVLVECWNTIGDVGAAARSTDRKLAEARQLAIALGADRPHQVASCWVVRSTTRNRAIVARYPAVFAARFLGSSWQWVRALLAGEPPPSDVGLVWCDVGTTRLYAWRRPDPAHGWPVTQTGRGQRLSGGGTCRRLDGP